MANVGKNIKKLRMNCKMTQDALAEQLFVSRQTVSNYENGKSNPDIDMLVKIAEVFGTDVNELIYGPQALAKNKVEKREYGKLGIAAALLVVTGVIAIVFEQSGMALWFYHRYISWPRNTLYMIVKPFVCLGLGWSVMQTAYIFFGAKRLKVLQGKAARIIRRIAIGILLVYLILVLLPILEEGIGHFRYWIAEKQGLLNGFEVHDSVFPWERWRLWIEMWYRMQLFNKSYSAVYIFPGIFFWASAPESTSPEAQPEKKPNLS